MFIVQQLRRFKFGQKLLVNYLILPSKFPLFENYHFFRTFSCNWNSSRHMFYEIWFWCEIDYTCCCFRVCVCVCVCACVWHRSICYKNTRTLKSIYLRHVHEDKVVNFDIFKKFEAALCLIILLWRRVRCVYIAARVLSIGNRWRREFGGNFPWLYTRKEYHRYVCLGGWMDSNGLEST